MSGLFTRILVPLPHISEAEYHIESHLVSRALHLAGRFKSELIFLQTLRDEGALQSAFYAEAEGMNIYGELILAEQNRVHNLVTTLQDRYPELKVSGKLSRGVPRADAIIEEAKTSAATLILKESREEKYLLGLLSNTDWDLLREAATPVWLVHGPGDPDRGIVCALELDVSGDGDLTLDERVFTTSRTLSENFDAPLFTVHAFEPPAVPGFENYVPLFPGEVLDAKTIEGLDEAMQVRREKIAREHGDTLSNFMQGQALSADDVILKEGPPSEVIKQVAMNHQAGLIVMGAAPDKGRWERLTRRVTAEATIDDSPCDMLFLH